MKAFLWRAADTDFHPLWCWHGALKCSGLAGLEHMESSGTSLDVWCGQRSPGALKFTYCTRFKSEGRCSPCSMPPSCKSHVFWHEDSLSRVNAAVHISVLFSDQRRTLSVCPTPVVLPTLPPSFHWQAVCLFVVMSLFLFNHSGCFFVSFYRQHASTNATMVFKANCDVHYFHCCLILFGLFSSRIDWQANSPPFFLCCDLCSPSPLFPQSSALREPTVLTIFRRLVDAWLQCCVVLFSLHSYWRKKVWEVTFNFPRMLTIIYVRTPFFSTILVASLFDFNH